MCGERPRVSAAPSGDGRQFPDTNSPAKIHGPLSYQSYDLAVVGAGICGVAHALAAARRKKRVVVIDRDAQANGASVRNFGFVTVTSQQARDCWRRAMRSRDGWVEVAAAAKIPIVQSGLLTIARRPEARTVLEEFLETEMGAECRLVEPDKIADFGDAARFVQNCTLSVL